MPKKKVAGTNTYEPTGPLRDTTYFLDGKRKIDFVIVFKDNVFATDDIRMTQLQIFLTNARRHGLETEVQSGPFLDNLICVKFHAPSSVLEAHQREANIEPTMNNRNYKYEQRRKGKLFGNILTMPDPSDPTVRRAGAILTGVRPNEYTDAERIAIVEKILSKIEFNSRFGEVGYQTLKRRQIIIDAYALHDSSSKWTKKGPLGVRQLLAKYWANLSCFYKDQPHSLIEMYYGPEVAFYFAWMGFYTKMLVPASIFGIICFCVGLVFYVLERPVIQEDICNSQQVLCPVCPGRNWCKMVPLDNSCTLMKVAYILDNPATVLYSIVMSFWGVIFLVLWRREEAMMKVRWNVTDIVSNRTVRLEFIRGAPLGRQSSITGEFEYYYPTFTRIVKRLVTCLGILIMCVMYALGIVAVMTVRLNVLYFGFKSQNEELKEKLPLIVSIVSAVLTFCVIRFFNLFKDTVTKILTEWENPRTEAEYTRHYTVNVVILSLTNILLPISYLAFVKGHFYTHPGDDTQWTVTGMFKADVCKSSGCLVDLSLQLLTILVLNNCLRLWTEVMTPKMKIFCQKLSSKNYKKQLPPEAEQWERDLELVDVQQGFLYSEYITVVIQLAFVTFFVVALPLTPLLALLNNVVELRLDAKKFLFNYKRIIMRRVNGIEEWNMLVQVITIVGAISNPLLVAFSSNIVPKFLYRSRNKFSLRGFMNSTLSEFAVDDYAGHKKERAGWTVNTCYYMASRYPPTHPRRYQLTEHYWYQFSVQCICFIVLENMCLLLSLMLGYMIPRIPRKVQLLLEYNEKLDSERRS